MGATSWSSKRTDIGGSEREAATEHEGAVLSHITAGDFMATHWLVSFALLADGALDLGADGAGGSA